ncbi:MAG TPA: TetR family transcriptional regulator [Ramlibacter sp.]|nr:TetR family transcriptional regulator [Ramlibacter sp.]
MDLAVSEPIEHGELFARRRAQLVHAAIEEFSRVGYHEATVKQIALAAQVSAGLVYQYVSDKEDLLFLCLAHIVERHQREIPAALEGVREPLRRLVVAVEAYSRITAASTEAVVLTYRETKTLKREYVEAMKRLELESNELIADCLRACVKAGLLQGSHTELVVYRITTNAHAWALKNWRLGAIVVLDQYIDQCVHACWTPLLTPAGRKAYKALASRSEQGAAP